MDQYMKNNNQGEKDKCHDVGINLEFIKTSNDSDNSEDIGEEF